MRSPSPRTTSPARSAARSSRTPWRRLARTSTARIASRYRWRTETASAPSAALPSARRICAHPCRFVASSQTWTRRAPTPRASGRGRGGTCRTTNSCAATRRSRVSMATRSAARCAAWTSSGTTSPSASSSSASARSSAARTSRAATSPSTRRCARTRGPSASGAGSPCGARNFRTTPSTCAPSPRSSASPAARARCCASSSAGTSSPTSARTSARSPRALASRRARTRS
mmetsp:Transcript_26098/g.66263  ORF Transcript_26098/g.66263 Transcript_26098/m.66263 type:complete len:230 (-) Transcript_26098:629-1318(-)